MQALVALERKERLKRSFLLLICFVIVFNIGPHSSVLT